MTGFFFGMLFTLVAMLVAKKYYLPTTNASTSQTTTAAVEEPVVEELSDDFSNFYIRFHEDSLYQINHISWPLEGLPAKLDSIAGQDFKWQKEDWVLHRPFDPTSQTYVRSFDKISPDVIVEYIQDRNGQFGMMRRFARLGDDWNLIYYVAMNRLKR